MIGNSSRYSQPLHKKSEHAFKSSVWDMQVDLSREVGSFRNIAPSFIISSINGFLNSSSHLKPIAGNKNTVLRIAKAIISAKFLNEIKINKCNTFFPVPLNRRG